jgi:ACT domain-containing protein
MMVVVDFQEVNMSKMEFDYYQDIVKQLTDDKINGKEYFRDLFLTDNTGIVSIVKPKNNVPWVVIHFLQQLQINQHLRINDTEIEKIKERLKKIEGE